MLLDGAVATGCGMLCTAAVTVPDLAAMTPRELEVFRLLGRGDSNRLMARRLGISERTVKAHISRVLEKTGAVDRVHAVYLANQLHHLLCDDVRCVGLPKGQ